MQETLGFLKVLDQPIRRSKRSMSQRVDCRRTRKTNHANNPFQEYQYWKGLKFNEQTLNSFPAWMTDRPEFAHQLYKNYEQKVLVLPKVCQKKTKQRSPQDLYLLQVFLRECPLVKGLPNSISQLVYEKLGVRYYAKDQTIHNEADVAPFVGVIFIGEVEYTENNKVVRKTKNDIIISTCFYKDTFPTVVAKEATIVLILAKDLYPQIKERLSVEVEQRHKETLDQLPKSDLFTQLHLKDKRSKAFVKSLEIEFFFKGETICSEGDDPTKFYILFMGKIQRCNHIYIRQHNKWPILDNKWEIRAVYKSYQKQSLLNQFDFFCDEQLISGNRLRSTYVAVQHTTLYSLSKELFHELLNTQDFKRLKKYRNQHTTVNYPELERDIRKRNKQKVHRRKIAHHAIDTSFCNRSNLGQLERVKKKLEPFQKSMIQKAQI